MPKPGNQTVHVTGELIGRTLGDVVRRGLKLSWGEAERMVIARRVAVHGNLCMDPDRRLKAGDVVNVRGEAAQKPPEGDDLNVLFQDRHLLVVDKPAGVVSVRERREKGLSAKRRERQATLDELLASRVRRNERVIPVHRLDRDTSGPMLFAKTPEAERALAAMFQAHVLDRRYRAVVHGTPIGGKITSLLVRDRGDGRRGSLPPGGDAKDGQRAVTFVEPLNPVGDGRRVVECRLETGRTHQIRIHLSEAGHPVCGDKLYAERNEQHPPPRQALHAFSLSFDHPMTGRPMRFERDWPADLARWLRRFGRLRA